VNSAPFLSHSEQIFINIFKKSVFIANSHEIILP
jgi:hypothetical protein